MQCWTSIAEQHSCYIEQLAYTRYYYIAFFSAIDAEEGEQALALLQTRPFVCKLYGAPQSSTNTGTASNDLAICNL